jgi:hypothetical protein
MHVYSCVAWQQTSYSSVLLLGVYHVENTVSLLLLPVMVFTELFPGNTLIKSITLSAHPHLGLPNGFFQLSITSTILVNVQQQQGLQFVYC